MSPLLKQLLLPPSILLLLILFGLAFARRRWGIGWSVAMASSLLLYLLASPIGSAMLSRHLEVYPALPMTELPGDQAQAIVILGSDSDYSDEFGGDDVGMLTLARLRYGAFLHRRTGLPLLLSGGPPKAGTKSLAQRMDRVMTEEYLIDGNMLETKSLDTWENAVNSSAILRGQNLDRVYLVTHARDLKRAIWAFQRNGVTAIAAPTGFDELQPVGLAAILPSGKALLTSYYALYEMVGGATYSLIH